MKQRNFIKSRVEMEKILKEEKIGFLSMANDNKPYTVPITYGYDNGRIIVHGALSGRRLEYIQKNKNVCFTVGREFGKTVKHPQGAACHADSHSVVCIGKARIIDDAQEKCEMLNIFNKCIRPGAREIRIDEIENCSAIEIRISEMTGRIEKNSTCEYFIHHFEI